MLCAISSNTTIVIARTGERHLREKRVITEETTCMTMKLLIYLFSADVARELNACATEAAVRMIPKLCSL
jgi:hypothetical protein